MSHSPDSTSPAPRPRPDQVTRAPLRVALIAPPWLPVPPPLYGGTETVLAELATGLLAAGHSVQLFTTGDSTCPVPRSWTYDTAQTERLGDSVVEARHLLDAYDAVSGADVVHDHTVTGPLLAAASPRPVPVLTTCHGPFDEDLRPIYRRIAPQVPLIAISAHQRRTARPIPVAATIHHGVDPARFPIGRGDGGYVAFLGRMTPGKGVDTAASVARSAGVPLKIAAKMREPAERDYFDRCVRPLLGAEVEYLGEVGGQDKLALLGSARALLNPLRWDEPFGMVMIEALACGTPIVATERGSVPEIVTDGLTGFLARTDAELIRAVQCVDELDRTACRASVETRFSTARMVSDHVTLYRRLISTRRQGLDRRGPGTTQLAAGPQPAGGAADPADSVVA